MLTSVLKFLKGYVVVHLSGYSPERFLNLCCHHKIVLWGLRSTGTEYEMCMSIAAFRKVRPLVRKTQTKVVILERHGLPFLLWKYRRRKLFAAGAFFCIVLLYIMSLFIWNIHIEGRAGEEAERAFYRGYMDIGRGERNQADRTHEGK